MKTEKEGKNKMKSILLAFVALIVAITIGLCAARIPDIINSTIDDLINSGELESIIQDQVDSEFDSAVEDPEIFTVSGVWMLNEKLIGPEKFFAPIEQNVEATLEWSYTTVNVSKFIIYDVIGDYGTSYDLAVRTVSDNDDLDNQSGYLYMDSDSGWGGAIEPRIWDFGTEPQEVSEEFYTWLTYNATQQ